MECIIYKKIKPTTQSGTQLLQHFWNLTLQTSEVSYSESTLKFNTLDEAVCYAQKNKLNFKIIDIPEAKIKRRTYAENFTKKI